MTASLNWLTPLHAPAAGDLAGRAPRRSRSKPAQARPPAAPAWQGSNVEPSWLRSVPSRRQQEPASLRNTWAAWCTAHPAAHGHAEAAAALHVTEAALLNALEGDGITPLRPDLAGLLATATSWGRFLVEIHHPLGDVCLSMAPSRIQLDEKLVTLEDACGRVLLSTQGLSHCYLVTGPTPGCYGLHWFNGDGEVMARIHLPATSVQHQAIPHLLQFTTSALRRGQPMPALTRPPELHVRPGWCAIDTLIKSEHEVNQLVRRIGMALAETPAMSLDVEGRGAALSYRGKMTEAQATWSPAWLSEDTETCRLHLRAVAVSHAFVCIAPEGSPFLRLHGNDGGTMTLQPDLDPLASRAWIDRLLPERRA